MKLKNYNYKLNKKNMFVNFVHDLKNINSNYFPGEKNIV